MLVQIDDQFEFGTVGALCALVDGRFVRDQRLFCAELFAALANFAGEQDDSVLR